jgi:N-acetylneuraminate synthase
LTTGNYPYIIAEIGVNHEGSMAKRAGADAVKFQAYRAATLATSRATRYWDGRLETTHDQRGLFAKYDKFGESEYRSLAAYCIDIGIDFGCTPFDHEAVDYLEPLVAFYKVASGDITNVPLLRYIAGKGKMVIMSTGASRCDEICRAVLTLRKSGGNEIALLHCVSSYPTQRRDANLRMIVGLQRSFPGVPIGYSDHTIPDDTMSVLVTAATLGAVALEKHFTWDKRLSGNDHYHAMDAADLQRLRRALDNVFEILGPTSDRVSIDAELGARAHARRGIVAKTSVRAGATLGEEHLTTKRPADGISPLDWDRVVGCETRRNLDPDDPVRWEDLVTE